MCVCVVALSRVAFGGFEASPHRMDRHGPSRIQLCRAAALWPSPCREPIRACLAPQQRPAALMGSLCGRLRAEPPPCGWAVCDMECGQGTISSCTGGLRRPRSCRLALGAHGRRPRSGRKAWHAASWHVAIRSRSRRVVSICLPPRSSPAAPGPRHCDGTSWPGSC